MLYALGSVQVSAAPYLLTIFTALAACVLILAWAALVDSDAETLLVRAGHKLRLSQSRMGHLLRRRHVDVAAYAKSLTVVELKRQVAQCRDCGLTELCDRALAGNGASRSSFSFCPNRSAIDRFLAPLGRLHAANG